MMEKRDEEYIRDVQDGDILAFENIVRRYQSRLFSFVMHLVRDPEVAQDVVQDSFVNLYKTVDRVDTKRKFSFYVFSIAKNTAFSYLRRQKKQVSLDDVAELAVDELLYEKLFDRDQAQAMERRLAELDEKYRRVITLYYYKDLSYEEISRKLRMPVNTVRTHLSRAKVFLRALISYENS
ncbi:sigma-70 family RNA polymerase sigma factor [Candidatus Gottesmanbacteria bacterium]|nr:sigma-70 family RNA polymerase sigma factor [Candidatus Gottesmanbacteria bacterium]